MLGGPYRGRVYAGALRSPASGGALLQPRTDPSRKAPASPWTGTRWAGRNGGSRSASPPREGLVLYLVRYQDQPPPGLRRQASSNSSSTRRRRSGA